MDNVDLLLRYFPDLTTGQLDQFTKLGPLYAEWNEKINVISRKDVENLYVNHVLHSLGIARVQTFRPESDVLDVGTGGGFPGIPLAILFPFWPVHWLCRPARLDGHLLPVLLGGWLLWWVLHVFGI